MNNPLRELLNEAAFKSGENKYMAHKGKYYKYTPDGKKTAITEGEYKNNVVDSRSKILSYTCHAEHSR
jgi:hypothetical protein